MKQHKSKSVEHRPSLSSDYYAESFRPIGTTTLGTSVEVMDAIPQAWKELPVYVLSSGGRPVRIQAIQFHTNASGEQFVLLSPIKENPPD